MTDDLVAFLRARLDEDEQTARAASAGPWRVNSETYAEKISDATGTDIVAGGRWGGEASVFESTEDALHIARHDPARVLADVYVKRCIIDQFTMIELPAESNGDTAAVGAYVKMTGVLRLLALPWREHPDYRSEWAPEV
jgi:hypothetical protein